MKRNFKIINFLYLQFAYFLYSTVGIFSKRSSQYKIFSLGFTVAYGISILILVVYTFFWQKIIKHFELTVAYSNKGVVILWTLLWSVIFYGESIKLTNILGSAIIIIGIMVVADDYI